MCRDFEYLIDYDLHIVGIEFLMLATAAVLAMLVFILRGALHLRTRRGFWEQHCIATAWFNEPYCSARD